MEAISRHFVYLVDERIKREILNLREPRKGLATSPGLLQVRTIYDELHAYHRALKFVSFPRLRHESILFVADAWKKVHSSTLPEPPSLALSSELDPSEHLLDERDPSFPQAPQKPTSLIALGRAQYASPLLWPALMHEIGHRIAQGVPVLAPVIGGGADKETLKRWLEEMWCDRLALELCGPAFLLDLVTRAILDVDYHTASASHPSRDFRCQTLIGLAPPWMAASPVFQEAVSLHRSRRADRSPGIPNNAFVVTCLLCRNTRKLSLKSAIQHEARVTDALERSIESNLLTVERLLKEDFVQIASLSERLDRGELIGAAHDAKRARETVKVLRRKVRARTFKPADGEHDEALESVVDDPVDPFLLLNVGWNTYLKDSRRRFQRLLRSSPNGYAVAWQAFKADVRGADELLLASIESSQFHKMLSWALKPTSSEE